LGKEKGESKDNVVNFMKKFKVFSSIQEVLVPLQYANHWSVIVMNVSHFMHYDLLKTINIFQFASVHRVFAKMWTIAQGKLLGTFEWKRIVSKNGWVLLDGPQQLFD
jgi:hypothetical protein